MLSDEELMTAYFGVPHYTVTRDELAGLRAVAEAAAKQALEDAADEVANVLDSLGHEMNENQRFGYRASVKIIRRRAASISADKKED